MVFRLLVSFLLLVPVTSWSQTSAPAQPPPAVQTQASPALWRVHGVHGTMYLFGTVHVMRKEVQWQTPKVTAAFKASDLLYLEVPGTDDPAAKEAVVQGMQLGLDPDHPLSAKLSKDDLARLDAGLKTMGLPGEQAIDAMRPWLAYVTLSLVPALQAGYSPTSGVDTTLAAEAKEQGTPIKGLETFDEQFHLLSSFSEPQQLQLLHEEIENLPKGVEETNRVVADWTRGDVDAIAAIDNGELKQKHPEIYEKLLVSRNVHFADTLTTLLKDPTTGTVFVAIGAGHLAGPDSVLALLTRRGFTVTRLE